MALIVLLIVAVQIGGFVLLNTRGAASVRKVVSTDIVAGGRAFERLLELDTQRLIEGVRLLTADPAFREMAIAGDRNALSPVLAKQAKRTNAAVMLLVGADHRTIAGTPENEVGRRVTYARLLDRAAAAQQAAGIALIGGKPYQLAIVPVLTPQPVAWIVSGFRIDDALAQELRTLTQLEVSFLGRQGEGEWRAYASTLAEAERAALTRDMAANRYSSTDADGNSEFGDAAISRIVNLAPRADDAVVAVLQRPLAPSFGPFHQMQVELAWLGLLGIVAAIVTGMALGGWIAAPLRELSSAARRVAAGDYTAVAERTRKDEVGDLHTAFRTMQEAIANCVSKMTDRAHRDTLTGLPTRLLFVDRLEQAVTAAARAGSPVAVLVLNLDQFGRINDMLGHPIGDLLLREVAARLRATLRRATDSVARIGGDEFAILMPGGRVSDAQRVAGVALRALEVKMTLDGHVVDVRASVGIAACPDHGSDPMKLLERADAAMHAAKRERRGISIWDEQFDAIGEQRMSLLSDLRKAVDDDELALVYQPRITLGDGGEHFVEALVRWQHPNRGLVPPSEFVPFAEQTGYIRTVTQWVLGHALAQCAEWRGRGLPMNVSVNISARDLIDVDFPVRLAAMLEREGWSAQWLTLEVPETALVGESGHALKGLERLHELGCRLAIDDCGTGNLSVAFLGRLPVDELKIDKGCIAGMAKDESDALVVRTTIELAHQLGLAVVASSVEDEATLEQLRELGCDGVQGFLLSRPLDAADVPSWVKESIWSRSAREKGSLRRVV